MMGVKVFSPETQDYELKYNDKALMNLNLYMQSKMIKMLKVAGEIAERCDGRKTVHDEDLLIAHYYL